MIKIQKPVVMDPKKLVPYENNAKKHPQEQIDLLARNLIEFGFDQPIVVDEEHVIIKGHCRREAAIQAGLKRVPVIVRKDLTPIQIQAARVADNKLAETDWDIEILKIELEALKDIEDLDFSLLGFTDAYVANVFEDPDFNIEEEWQGMPEFEQEKQESFRTIIVHFDDEESLKNFTSLMDQTITDKTRYIWFPKKEQENLKDISYE